VSDGEWKDLLDGVPVDRSLFNGVQPHYTAAPVFSDASDDPCVEGRLAILPGSPELIIPAAAAHRRSTTPSYARSGGLRIVPPKLGPRDPYVTTRAEQTMLDSLREIRLAEPGNTHPTAVRVACRLLSLAAAGLLDPTDAASRVKAALERKTHREFGEAEIHGILAWAWSRTQQEHRI
jgi:hypothetical protein